MPQHCNIFVIRTVYMAESNSEENEMKFTAKFLSVLMIAVMALGMVGCGVSARASKPDINELMKIKGDMLVIVSHPQMATTEEQYKNGILRMSVSYDGCANNPNPINNSLVKMPEDEYLKIYNFCVDAAAKNKFAGYKEQVCDGETYTFTFYDTEGQAHVLYDGYCYENKELKDIINMISKYSLD